MSYPLTLLMAAAIALFYADAFLLGASAPQALLFMLLAAAVAVGFREHAEHGPHGRVQAAPAMLAATAAAAVMLLQRQGTLSVVVAAALVGAAGGLLERQGRPRRWWQGSAGPIYCGAFVGMTSELVLDHPAWVLLAGLLAGVLLALLESSWRGIGGKLGTTALVAVFAVTGLAAALGHAGSGVPLHRFGPLEWLLVWLFSVVSPLLTHWLSTSRGLGAVLGSSLPSLLVGLLLTLPGPQHAPPLAAVWLGGSFVGMTELKRLQPHPRRQLVAMGLIFAALTLAFEPRLEGLGGDLGAMAAVSVFAVLGLGVLGRQLQAFRGR